MVELTPNGVHSCPPCLRSAGARVTPGFLHLGGDELMYECWENSKAICDYMAKHGLRTMAQLERYFWTRVRRHDASTAPFQNGMEVVLGGRCVVGGVGGGE